jgi:hypothetical protein
MPPKAQQTRTWKEATLEVVSFSWLEILNEYATGELEDNGAVAEPVHRVGIIAGEARLASSREHIWVLGEMAAQSDDI